MELRNGSGLEFTDISSEEWRKYEFPDGTIVTVPKPQFLNVAKSGGHRVLDGDGVSHYVPWGWKHLSWKVFPDQPHFVK